MGGIANGIAYHGGFIPYCATFLTFSDYMRGSVRLASLSGSTSSTSGPTTRSGSARTARPTSRSSTTRPSAPSRTCGSSDRATPTRPRRPGRWRSSARDGPVALALTRQKLPTLPGTAELARDGVARGGYVLREATGGAPRADPHRHRVRAAARVRRGRGARNGGHPDARRLAALLGAVRARRTRSTGTRCCHRPSRSGSASKSASSLGWERWVGDEGAIIGLDHFGASAPAGDDLRALRVHGRSRRRYRPQGRPRRAARPDPDAGRWPQRPAPEHRAR